MNSISDLIDDDDLEYFLPSNIFCEQNKNNGNTISNKLDYSHNNQINAKTRIVSESI